MKAIRLPEERYGTHKLYPYKGSMHPARAREALGLADLLTGSTVLDPFCGSGTVLVESIMTGLNAIGFDVLPTCCIASTVKTRFTPGDEPDMDSVETRLHMAMASKMSLDDALEDILSAFGVMRSYVEKYDIPLGNAVVYQAGQLLDEGEAPPEVKVDAIITSPPYGNLIDYVTESIAGLLTIGMNLTEIGRLRRLMTDGLGYEEKVREHADKFAMMLPSGAPAVLVIGPDKEKACHDIWIRKMRDAGFQLKRLNRHTYNSTVNEIGEEYTQLYERE